MRGQRDAVNPSEFTVDFDADDRRVRMRGRLVDAQTLAPSLVEPVRRDGKCIVCLGPHSGREEVCPECKTP